jgi:hypothetical protein
MEGEASDERTLPVRRDNGDGMSAQEDRCNTGSPCRGRDERPTRYPRGIGWATQGDGEARSTAEAG